MKPITMEQNNSTNIYYYFGKGFARNNCYTSQQLFYLFYPV
jgi:hypothetical protein